MLCYSSSTTMQSQERAHTAQCEHDAPLAAPQSLCNREQGGRRAPAGGRGGQTEGLPHRQPCITTANRQAQTTWSNLESEMEHIFRMRDVLRLDDAGELQVATIAHRPTAD